MDIVTVKSILALAQGQLSSEDYSALHKTIQREYLYSQIDECERMLSRKVYPVAEKPLMEQAREKYNNLNQQLAAL